MQDEERKTDGVPDDLPVAARPWPPNYAPEKDCLTVLDFIGQANKRYNFEEKFRALLTNTKHSVDYELKHGFVSAPKGCYVQFEKKAQEYILDNIRASYSGKRGLISRIESFEEDTEKELTFANFISHYHMDAREIYGKFSFARLMVWAGVREDFSEPAEEVLTKAINRIVAIDSRRWIEFLLDVHCAYTVRQILAAFDDEKVISSREGVKWLPAKNMDMFFITLNK